MELARTAFCILGNKIDLQGAASEDELRLALGLMHHVTYGKEVGKVSVCSTDCSHYSSPAEGHRFSETRRGLYVQREKAYGVQGGFSVVVSVFELMSISPSQAAGRVE